MTITHEEIQLASGARLDAIGAELGNYKRISQFHNDAGDVFVEPDVSFRAHLLVMFDMERH